MNCDQAIEFLPWLLNGTLEAGERDEVRRHLADCERCRAALNDTREAWTTFDQHLPSDALVALAYGEAPQGIDSALAERHLASCPQCAAELELARMSRRLEEDDKVMPFPGPRPVNEERDRGYRSWRAAAMAAGFAGLVAATGWFYEFQQVGNLAMQVAQRPAPSRQIQPTATPSPAPVRQSPGVSDQQVAEFRKQIDESQQRQQKLAADLKQTQDKIATLSRDAMAPQINVQTLTSPEVVRDGNGPEAKEIVFPSGQPVLVSLSTASEKAVRDMDVVDRRGKILFSERGLRENRGEYPVGFRAGSLEPGRYTIQLYETVNGKRIPRESYKIRVE